MTPTRHSLSLRYLAVSAGLAFLLTSAVSAQTHVWNTPGSGNWSLGTNWSTGTPPNGPADYPSISFSAVGPYTVTLDMNVALDQFLMTGDFSQLSLNGRTVDMSGFGRMGPGNNIRTTMISSSWLGAGTLDNEADFDALGTSHIEHLLQNGNFRVLGSPTGSTANLTLGSNALNHGVIDLTSEVGGYSSNLTVSPGAVLQNDGYLNFQPGAGGARSFTGHLSTNAPVAVNTNSTFKTGPLDLQGWDFTIAPTVLFNVNTGVTVNMTGGLLDVQGSYFQTSGTFNFDGGTVPLVADLAHSTLSFGAGSAGVGLFDVHGTTTLLGNPVAGQQVTVMGSPSGGTAVANIPNDINLTGTLDVSSEGGGYTSNVVQAATTTFTNNGLIRILAGAGGARSLKGALNNFGNIEVKVPTAFQDGPVSNSGSLVIEAAGAMNMLNGQDFDQLAGNLTVDGSFTHVSGTDSFLGGTVTGQPVLRHTALDFDTSGFTAPADIRLEGANSLTTDVPAATTLRLFGSAGGGTLTLNVNAPATFAGTTEITSANGGYTSILVATAGNSITNTGTLRSILGTGGNRNLNGTFQNSGVVEIDVPTAFRDGPVSNLGSWTIASTGAVNMLYGQDFDQVSGTFAVDGSFTHVSGTDSFLAGTVTGQPVLRHTTLDFAPSSFTAPASFRLEGANSLLTDVPAATTMQMYGSPNGGTQSLTLPNSVTLAGTMEMTSEGGGYTSILTVASGALATNTGTLRFLNGTGGGRTFSGDFLNQGAVEIERPTTYSSGTFTNQGVVGVSLNQSLNLNSGTTFLQEAGGMGVKGSFVHVSGVDRFTSGKIMGQLVLRHSTLTFDPVYSSAIDLFLEGTTTFTGQIKAGQELNLAGSPNGGTQNFNASAGLNNAGVMRLTSVGGGYTSIMTITGGPLNNSGSLEVLPGAGGGRNITADLENHGTFDLQGANVNLTGAVTNFGDGIVKGTGTINATSMIQNNGIFSPGAEVGTLAISGHWTQTGSGRLKIDLGGYAPGTDFDVLDVSGTATLAGQVRIASINGFEPAFGDLFSILNANAIIGEFDSVVYQGPLASDLRIDLVYTSVNVYAQVVHRFLEAGAVARPFTVSNPSPGIAGQSNIWQIDGATGLGSVELAYGTVIGFTPVGPCASQSYNIQSAIVLGTAPVSNHGTALISAMIPGTLAGTTIYFQAADLSNCFLTDLVTFVLP
jgi:hypothetical protein